MSDFNSAENQAHITKLFDQSEDLIKRSKQLSEEFGTSTKGVIILGERSEELILQTRKSINNIKAINNKTF
jgi:hypothetical protein